MALSDIAVANREIRHRGKCFTVRGLSFEDVSKLLFAEPEKLEALVAQFGELDRNMSETQVNLAAKKLGMTLVGEMPDFAAKIIAVACDEPEAWQTARKLPAPVQLDALMAIGELTFVDAQGAVDFLGNVLSMVTEVTKTVQSVRAALPEKSTGTPG